MRYKPDEFEQAKFDYSSLGKIFTKGLDKDDKKERLFKGLENIKDKNEELLNAFGAANKVSKAAKNQSDYNYDNIFTFYRFYRGFKIFKIMSLGSKYDELNDFYTFFNAFINTHQATTTEMNNVNQLYNDYFNLYKISYNSANVRNDEKQRPVPT